MEDVSSSLITSAISWISYLNMWFRRDGDISHKARETLNLFKFGEHVIFQYGGKYVMVLALFCGIHKLFFFYSNKPKTSDYLKTNSSRILATYELIYCKNVTKFAIYEQSL